MELFKRRIWCRHTFETQMRSMHGIFCVCGKTYEHTSRQAAGIQRPYAYSVSGYTAPSYTYNL